NSGPRAARATAIPTPRRIERIWAAASDEGPRLRMTNRSSATSVAMMASEITTVIAAEAPNSSAARLRDKMMFRTNRAAKRVLGATVAMKTRPPQTRMLATLASGLRAGDSLACADRRPDRSETEDGARPVASPQGLVQGARRYLLEETHA